jgi:hypothetical protein
VQQLHRRPQFAAFHNLPSRRGIEHIERRVIAATRKQPAVIARGTRIHADFRVSARKHRAIADAQRLDHVANDADLDDVSRTRWSERVRSLRGDASSGASVPNADSTDSARLAFQPRGVYRRIVEQLLEHDGSSDPMVVRLDDASHAAAGDLVTEGVNATVDLGQRRRAGGRLAIGAYVRQCHALLHHAARLVRAPGHVSDRVR